MAPGNATLARAVLTGLTVALLVSPLLAAFGVFGRPVWWVLLAAFVGIAGLVAAVFRSRNARSETDGSSVWDAIPDWQYDGRHVESGGLTRDEQEQSIRDVQRRAEAEERRTK